MRSLAGGETALTSFLPAGSGGQGGSAAARLKELMESVETLKAERAVIDSELRNTNVDIKVGSQFVGGGGSNIWSFNKKLTLSINTVFSISQILYKFTAPMDDPYCFFLF